MLQAQDLSDILSSNKGKCREGEICDSQLAVEWYSEELQRVATITSDRRMCCSISCAVQDDGPLLATATEEEEVALRDRELAHRLAGVQPRYGPSVASTAKESSHELRSFFSSLHFNDDKPNSPSSTNASARPSELDPEEGSSRSDAGRRSTELILRQECVACARTILPFDDLQAPCGHHYCRDCTVQLFNAATTDESLFPVRCCRQLIPISRARHFLPVNLIQLFQRKAIEFSTSNRTYCAEPTCSAFVVPDSIKGDIAVCTVCRRRTCTICKGEAHEGDCPADSNLQLLLKKAEDVGWQRCYQCRSVVELYIGCNHIT